MMNRLIHKLVVLFFVAIFPFSIFTTQPYRFGVHIVEISPDQTFGLQQQGYEIYLNLLAKKLDRDIQLIVFGDYNQLTDALDTGWLDFALVEIVPYALAKSKKLKMEKLLTVVTWNTETSQKSLSYSSYIIARMRKRSIANYYDLQGMRVGFVRNSASGYVYPVNFLMQHGIDYRTYFRETDFYNSHYELYDAFKAEQIDAAATSDADFDVNKFTGDFKIVTVIPGIPNPLIAASGKLSAIEMHDLKQSLLSMPSNAYTNLPFVGVQDTPNNFYDSAEEIVLKIMNSSLF